MADKLKIYLDNRKALATLKARLSARGSNATLLVGTLIGATRRMDSNVDERVPIAPYAAVQEFGSKHVPARAPFRRAFAEHKDEWKAGILEKFEKFPKWTAAQVLHGVQNRFASEVSNVIENDEFQPLKPATIRFKKKMGYPYPEKPMVATRSFAKRISGEVRSKVNKA